MWTGKIIALSILLILGVNLSFGQNTQKIDKTKINQFSENLLPKLGKTHSDVAILVKGLQNLSIDKLAQANDAEMKNYKEFVKLNIEDFSLVNKYKAEEKAEYLQQIADFYGKMLGITINAPKASK